MKNHGSSAAVRIGCDVAEVRVHHRDDQRQTRARRRTAARSAPAAAAAAGAGAAAEGQRERRPARPASATNVTSCDGHRGRGDRLAREAGLATRARPGRPATSRRGQQRLLEEQPHQQPDDHEDRVVADAGPPSARPEHQRVDAHQHQRVDQVPEHARAPSPCTSGAARGAPAARTGTGSWTHLQGDYRTFSGVASKSVTGPSLTSSTAMCAPNTPRRGAEPLAEALVQRLGHARAARPPT